ncbi:gpi anchored serine-threonine rich protein [Fusarium austroafricanum]|uniref:Gpi anchored serine-threonine rich protein n=1 Tax=Fusarium austroafricanum TaxID=2364996 RepID=A0A8H4KSB7_9HYPO|nr:gpi anchored serine-threonine rich protein [Fusarium austroafricanum]
MKGLLIALSASSALASVQYSPRFPLLAIRQVVEVPCSDQKLKDCGSGCIQLDWTCCPSREGGCPPSAYCEVGTNQKYGCCPNGSVCNGEGGGTTRGSTDTLTLAGGDTTTVVQGGGGGGANTAETTPPVLEGSSTAVIVPPPVDTASTIPPVLPPSPVNPAPVPGTPVPLPTPSTVVVNEGSSSRFSLVGGILAGLVALIF